MNWWKKHLTTQSVIALLMGILLLAVIIWSVGRERNKTEMTNLEFFKSLNYEDGLSAVVDTFERFPLQYATTLGQDGNP